MIKGSISSCRVIWSNTTNVKLCFETCTILVFKERWRNSQHTEFSCCFMDGIVAVGRSVLICYRGVLISLCFVVVDLNLYVGQLTSSLKSDPSVKHALAVQRALGTGNYHSLFDLYMNAPNMGAYIMDHFIDRERCRALIIMTKAYVHSRCEYYRAELTTPLCLSGTELWLLHLSKTNSPLTV